MKLAFVMADMGMGGAQRVVSLLAGKFAMRPGCQVHIVTMDDGAGKSFFPIPSQVEFHALGLTKPSTGFASVISSNVGRIKSVRGALKNIEPDCVISFQTETNCITLLAMMGTGIPVIISERSDPHIHPHQKIWRLLRRISYPLARGAVFQTMHAARFFKNTIKNKAVIFNPVFTDESNDGDIPPGPYILGVGRLSHEKGFDVLISAFSIAKKSCPDLKLVLVGSGPEKEPLQALAHALGIGHDIIFTGAQDYLAPYYRGALAFVLPSQFEGLPNALLEAMTYGCAVISTPAFAAAPEIITHGHNGLIAKSPAADAMAEEIIKVYKGKDLHEALGANAKAGAARFSADAIFGEWAGFLRDTGLNL